ncbi:MAG TPA: hypothetical protein VGA13_01710 [Acidimicrobiales bacterium]
MSPAEPPRLRIAVGAGFMVGLLGVVAVWDVDTVATGGPSPASGGPTTTTTGPPPQTDVAAARAFLVAWEHSRSSTYAVTVDFERIVDDVGQLAATNRIAQRPPDRLVIGSGSAHRRDATQLEVCDLAGDGSLVCSPPEPASPYSDEVAEAVAAVAVLVSDDPPEAIAPYAVAREGDDCFALTLRIGLPAPPFGDRARFCFDGATGAMISSEIRRQGSRDVTVARELTAVVTDADLELPDRLDPPATDLER